ncbi:MAG: hypothetical protein AAGL17_05820 [Cyanobacteria bacterium J06576_12]
MSFTTQKADAQTIDLDTLCQKYSRNSQCENYVAVNSEAATAESAFPRHAIRIKLNTIGSDNEIILIELREETIGDITLSAYHVEETEGFLNTAVNGVVGAFVPIPVDLFQFYDSNASQTEFLAFTPNSCQDELSLVTDSGSEAANCSIIGADAIALSEDVDIRSGFFTLRYREGDLLRATTFKIGDHDATFVSNIDTNNLCESYPTNSRCRYWPLSQNDQ